MNVLEKIRWKVHIRLQKTVVGSNISEIFYYWFDARHKPSDRKKQMNISTRFFDENKDREEAVLEMLDDSLSREVLKAAIYSRCTHDYRALIIDRKTQYFGDDFMPNRGKEVFVDCGAYNGDTIEDFIHFCNGNYKKIIAFEPNPENTAELKKKPYTSLTVHEALVWKENTELYFEGKGMAGKISRNTDSSKCIQACSIDASEDCKDASFIKMDVEGSEYEALLGAKETIHRNHPILAVCVYHKDEDYFRLIEMIHDWNLQYSFYVRHYTASICETVLYAIPKEV